MTADSAGPASPGASPGDPDPLVPGIPDDGDLDVLTLASQSPSQGGDWLLITALESQPGAGFLAQDLGRHDPTAHGGDVVVRIAPDAGPAVRAQVWAVLGGLAVLAGEWDGLQPGSWPERVRPAAALAMGLLTELEECGADLSAHQPVRLDDPDAAAVGVPFGITAGRVPGAG